MPTTHEPLAVLTHRNVTNEGAVSHAGDRDQPVAILVHHAAQRCHGLAPLPHIQELLHSFEMNAGGSLDFVDLHCGVEIDRGGPG